MPTETSPTLCLTTPSGNGYAVREPLRRAGAPFASGGDAKIYAVPARPDLVAKLYHDPAADPERPGKLRAMLAAPPALSPITHGGGRYAQLAWPTHVLTREDSAFVGYAMPHLPIEEAVSLEVLLTRSARRAYELPESYAVRVTVAANLAAVVAALHAKGHHVIDLKPANTLVYRKNFFVALLDCDGFSVAAPDGRRFPAHQYTPGFIAPEAAGRPPEHLGASQDCFALAVLLFRLLSGGVHPFQGVPQAGRTVPATNQERINAQLYAYGRRAHPAQAPSPWSLHAHFDDATRRLFDQAFAGDAAERPSAETWRGHLRWYARAETDGLVRCETDAEHWRFAGEACGHCALAARRAEAQQGQRKRSKRNAATGAKQQKRSASSKKAASRSGSVSASTSKSSVRPSSTATVPFGMAARLAALIGFLVVASLLVVVAANNDETGTFRSTDAVYGRNGGKTALMRAAEEGAADEVRSLLRSGAAVNERAEAGPSGFDQGRTALAFAVEAEDVETAALLLEHGADPNLAAEYSETAPLHRAVERESDSMTAVLLRHGADPNARQAEGVAPIHLAVQGRGDAMFFIIDTLLASGADVKARDAEGNTALMYAADSFYRRAPVMRLLSLGLDIDARNDDGRTALMVAAINVQHGTLSRLLLKGADPHLRDHDGRTALDLVGADRLAYYGTGMRAREKARVEHALSVRTNAADWDRLDPAMHKYLLEGYRRSILDSLRQVHGDGWEHAFQRMLLEAIARAPDDS